MKISASLAVCIISSIIFSSCLKDTGNYDYLEINEVGIEGIDGNQVYDVFAYVDTLKIYPVIKGEETDNSARYSYEWKIMKSRGENTSDSINYVVSRDRDLEYPVVLEPGEYKGYFKVTDNTEQTNWGTTFQVLVRSITNEGLIVLSEEGGQGRIDMIANVSATEYQVAYNVWQDEDYQFGKPFGIFFNYNQWAASTTYYVSEAGTYLLDQYLKTDESGNIKWSFGEPIENLWVLGSKSTTFSFDKSRELIVDFDQNLYSKDMTTHGSVYEFAINTIDGTTPFKASKHIGMPIPNSRANYFPFGHTILIYDDTHKQFLELTDANEFPTAIKFQNNDLFNPVTGRNMIHVESTLNRYTFAVLQDPNTHKYYIYGMTLGESAVNTQDYYLEIPGLVDPNTSKFAFHPLLPYLFYVTENEVYQYDYSQPGVLPKRVLTFPNARISVLKFFPMVGWNPYTDWERDKALKLVIAYNESSGDEISGHVELYEAPALAAPLIHVHSFDGFSEILDIALRER